MNNMLIIVGHAGKDPEKKVFESGKSLVTFSVAVKEFSAGDEEKTMSVKVEAWNGIGENVLATVTKGREGVFQGRLVQNKYKDGNGNDVTNHLLRLGSFHMTGNKPAGDTATEAGESTGEVVQLTVKPAGSRKRSK